MRVHAIPIELNSVVFPIVPRLDDSGLFTVVLWVCIRSRIFTWLPSWALAIRLDNCPLISCGQALCHHFTTGKEGEEKVPVLKVKRERRLVNSHASRTVHINNTPMHSSTIDTLATIISHTSNYPFSQALQRWLPKYSKNPLYK